MLKVEHLEVWGFQHAIRGMRNPMNSWEKSDSYWQFGLDEDNGLPTKTFVLGKADMELMQKLFNGGTEHRKFMRQLFISLDITAPLYWWKEFDTYKVGTVANSCSTMHKIAAKEFVIDDFSHEHLLEKGLNLLEMTCASLNGFRMAYLAEKDADQKKILWWQMIQALPSTYDQKRTITMNYENAAAIVHQRENHKQDEWREILVPTLLRELPYFATIIGRE